MGINSREYDHIASEIFLPIYPEIAGQILERSGIQAGQLLDLGCGGGHLGYAVMDRGDFQTTFFDLSEDMLKLAEQRGQAQGRSCRYVQGDVHQLPFSDGAFDLVVSRGSMPFWTDQKQAFREIWRVLKPGGKAYIGGGLGSAAQRQRIMDRLETEHTEFHCMDKSSSLALATEEYEALFRELGAHYQVYEHNGEGRWFLFGPPDR